jgi:hypothetical protein
MKGLLREAAQPSISAFARLNVNSWSIKMRLRSVHIENFRGVEYLEVADLKDMVFIAGPNGSGKTCVLDGIRLIKSVYGGYIANEWQTWFGEFQINITDPETLLKLFRNRQESLVISAEIELSERERDYLETQAEEVVRSLLWEERLGRSVGFGRMRVSASELTAYGSEIVEQARSIAGELGQHLSRPTCGTDVAAGQRLSMSTRQRGLSRDRHLGPA